MGNTLLKPGRKFIVRYGFIIVIVGFFFTVYLPTIKRVTTLNSEYMNLKSELQTLQYVIGGRDDIIKMHEKLDLLKKTLPEEKEVSSVVKAINQKARLYNVNIESLRPHNLEVFKDRDGRTYPISGEICKGMPISLKVEARYQGLGEFLDRLEKDRDPVIIVEGLDIYKDTRISPLLKVDLELVAYLRGK